MTQIYGAAAGPWRRTHPREASSYLAAITYRWWVAGGWALDLFLGTEGRPHRDLDIGILRRDAPLVLAGMSGFEFFEAMDGRLYRLESDTPRANIHSLWGRPLGTNQWVLELLLDESEHGDWIFRRDRKIHYPLDLLVQYDSNQIPYVVPEIQLLYKASHTRPQDEADFERTVPHLSARARGWLHRAIASFDPSHRWLRPLGPLQ
jgi:hypothetical protein